MSLYDVCCYAVMFDVIHLIHKWSLTWDERAAKHGIESFWDKISRSSNETSETMPVVLSESDIPGSSLNGRNPSELKNKELRFWLKCSDDPAKGLRTKAEFAVSLYCSIDVSI